MRLSKSILLPLPKSIDVRPKVQFTIRSAPVPECNDEKSVCQRVVRLLTCVSDSASAHIHVHNCVFMYTDLLEVQLRGDKHTAPSPPDHGGSWPVQFVNDDVMLPT